MTHAMTPMAALACSCDTVIRCHTAGGTHGRFRSRRGRARSDQPAIVTSSSASCTAQAANRPQVTAVGTRPPASRRSGRRDVIVRLLCRGGWLLGTTGSTAAAMPAPRSPGPDLAGAPADEPGDVGVSAQHVPASGVDRGGVHAHEHVVGADVGGGPYPRTAG